MTSSATSVGDFKWENHIPRTITICYIDIYNLPQCICTDFYGHFSNRISDALCHNKRHFYNHHISKRPIHHKRHTPETLQFYRENEKSLFYFNSMSCKTHKFISILIARLVLID